MAPREAQYSGRYDVQCRVKWRSCISTDELVILRPVYRECFSGLHHRPPQSIQRDDHHHRPWPLQTVPAIRAGHLQGSQECDTGPWSSLRLPDALDGKFAWWRLELLAWRTIHGISNGASRIGGPRRQRSSPGDLLPVETR